jgi:hypothetical protein
MKFLQDGAKAATMKATWDFAGAFLLPGGHGIAGRDY